MSGDLRAPRLGIVAGGGALPGLLISACTAAQRPCFVVGLTGFADSLPRPPDLWIRLGEVGKAFDAFKKATVGQVVLAGAVRRPSLSELKPDLKGAAVLARIAGRALGDDSLLSAVIGEIEAEGFTVVGADSILADLLAPAGPFGAHRPDAAAEADIRRGFQVAHVIGDADVGQAVVVQQGIVLGVEAVEGTDALLTRCGVLRREGVGGVLVKRKKPTQERRVDLPTIGVDTVRNAAAAGLRGIAVEAGHTLIIDRAAVAAAADAAGLFVVGVPSDIAGNG